MSEEELLAATGVPAPWGDEAFTIRERVSARPTLEINGLASGWTGPGPKTIIPATAMAKVSCRLVGNQDPQQIYEAIRDYVASIAPPTARVRVDLLTTGEPALIDFTLPEMQAAARAYENGWGATPVFTRGGGSIPIVADIFNLLHMPVVMMGYGLDTDGLHGTNEHYRIEMFQRGIETAIVYLDELAQLPR
jgi:acetylornithine deacetylase/succinyl-diaminopimelate desuccinylase-like protein